MNTHKGGLSMETKKGFEEKDGDTLLAEWEKPSVKELDINSITLSGYTGEGSDNVFYS